jgi:hypothetical protein
MRLTVQTWSLDQRRGEEVQRAAVQAQEALLGGVVELRLAVAGVGQEPQAHDREVDQVERLHLRLRDRPWSMARISGWTSGALGLPESVSGAPRVAIKRP